MATAALMGLTAVQTYGQYNAQKAQGDYQYRMARINAAEAEAQGKRVIEAGEKSATDYKKKINQLVGEQKTGFAAGGVDVSFGSAQQIQAETREVGLRDVQTIRTNAFLQAMGYQAQSQDILRQGQMARNAANFSANQTLLTGALRLGSQAYGAAGSDSGGGSLFSFGEFSGGF